jgi:hypothetical protein
VHRRQVGGGIGAEADKSRLAEGSQAADTGQHHQAEGDDGVKADVVQQRDMELGQQGRCRQQCDDEDQEEDRRVQAALSSSSST